MKIKRKSSLSTLLIIYLISILAIYIPYQATKAETSSYTIDLSLSPASSLINADNMVPGDSLSSVIQIQNNGNVEFDYFVSSRLEDEGELLFSSIYLEITNDNSDILYEGLLSELNMVLLGTLPSLEEISLDFLVTLPIGVGNEAQGESTSIAFDFVAQADIDDVIDIPEEEIPGGPPIIKIPNEETPLGPPDLSEKENEDVIVDIPEEEIPLGNLPKTATIWHSILLAGVVILLGSLFYLWIINNSKINSI